jgi:purine-nucleoside phosphorylase
MLSQISFTADKRLKEKTMQRAKEKGITLKSILVFSMEAFANGKINLGIIPVNEEIEELDFDSPFIEKKAEKLANLLK